MSITWDTTQENFAASLESSVNMIPPAVLLDTSLGLSNILKPEGFGNAFLDRDWETLLQR